MVIALRIAGRGAELHKNILGILHHVMNKLIYIYIHTYIHKNIYYIIRIMGFIGVGRQ